MQNIIISFISIIATALFFQTVVLPKQKLKHFSSVLDPFPAWKDFILSNINTCRTEQDCLHCKQLILLFDKKFRPQIPKEIFMRALENLWNRADTKYKLIKSEQVKHDSVPVELNTIS